MSIHGAIFSGDFDACGTRIHASHLLLGPRGASWIDDQRGMLALARRKVPGLHPFIGPAKKLRLVIVDVLIPEKDAQQLFRLQSAPRRRDDVVRITVEMCID